MDVCAYVWGWLSCTFLICSSCNTCLLPVSSDLFSDSFIIIIAVAIVAVSCIIAGIALRRKKRFVDRFIQNGYR